MIVKPNIRMFVILVCWLSLCAKAASFSSMDDQDGIPFLVPWPQEVKMVGAGKCVLGKQGEHGIEILSPEKGFFEQSRGLIIDTVQSMGFSECAKQPLTRIIIQSYNPKAGQLIRCQDVSLILSEPEVSVLSKSDQAYLIRISSDDQPVIWIVGASPLGAYYGTCTLIQLFEKDEQNRLVVGQVEIRDYPDTPFRMSADWVLGLDWHGNGYDWGDGLEAFIERCKRQIDFCSRHKVNLVRFLGGMILPGSDYSEPRYAMLKRFAPELNRYARCKGVCLQYSFSDWGMDYGEFGLNYPQPWALNRQSYPDGVVYPCLMGTVGDCLSNDALTKMITERIRQFVQEIEPGSIYLHHLDLDGSSQWPVYWAEKRCSRCRQQWPDDDWTSPQGLAGAMAHFMNAIISQVRSVRNSESGYNAADDLQIVFAGPYAGQDPDAYWDQYIHFFQNVGRQLNDKTNIQFVTREQYKRWDNRSFRTIELARAMEDVGWHDAVFMFAIQGGGFWYGSRMFNTSPVFSNIWNGAGTLYNFNGHVHCEAQVLANVNYAWNHHAPGWVDLADLNGREVQQEAFRYIPRQTDSPKYSKTLYGSFLDQACVRLYGEKAAPTIAAMFRLENEIGAIVPNVITMLRKKDTFLSNGMKQAKRNRQAMELVNQAVTNCDFPEGKEKLQHLASCLEISTNIFELAGGLYNTNIDSVSFHRQADELIADMDRKFNFVKSEPDGGDIGYWKPTVQWIRQQHELICRKNTLPVARHSWVKASSSQDDYPALSVFTADPTGRQWGQNGGWQDNTAYLFPDRLEFQFDSPQKIKGLTIYTLGDDWQHPEIANPDVEFSKFGITDLDVEVKSPSGDWVVVSRIRGNRNVKISVEDIRGTIESVRLKIFSAADGRYSRVVHVDFID